MEAPQFRNVALVDPKFVDNEFANVTKEQEKSSSSLISARVVMDGKLYDREEEAFALLKAYHRNTKDSSERSAMEFTIITGCSGAGKSYLAETLRPTVEKDGGMFLSGKFDHLDQPVHYAPLIQAFTRWVRLTQQGPLETLQQTQTAMTELVQCDRLLTDLIPALTELVVEEENARPHVSEDSKGVGAHERLVFSFRRFVRAICSPSRPLVLFLDDLQWAEPASISVLSALVSDPSIGGLMVLGAWSRG